MATNITSYLFFGGRTEEAMAFYAKALHAQTLMSMRFSDSPDAAPEGMIPPGFENKIMHAAMQIGASTVMFSDGSDPTTKFAGFRLALAYDTEAEAHAAFDALAVDGQVEMPLCKTFWSPCYGMLTDKFGLGWMVMLNE
jgi:PhnB protein